MNCSDGTGGRSLRTDPDHRFIYIPVAMKMRRVLRRPSTSVTIRDMAALTGVSPSTINRTYKDHPSISRQIKEKVRQAMAKLGHEPSFQAGSLATQNSHTVGITLPSSEWEVYQNPFCLEMIRGIGQYCSQKQYINTVIMGQNEDEILQAIKIIARTSLAEGFIVFYSREQGLVPDYLYEERSLYVLIGRACWNVNQAIYMDNDDILVDREAAEYLLNLGHVKIACLSGDRSLLYNHDRKMGYMLVLTERGTPSDDRLCIEVPSVLEGQGQAPAALSVREDRPTAVLVSDDILTVALEKACTDPELSIPGDVSILSFNNSLLARLTFPLPTFVDVNACQLGIEVAAQMISHVEDPELVTTKIIVPHHMVERESYAGAGGFCGD